MTIIQILIAGLVILILAKTVADFKKNKISRTTFLFWLILWLIILVVAILPQVTSFLAQLVGVGKGTNVVIYLSILFIFFILFKIITRLEKVDQEITEIVRHLTFKK